MKRISWENYFMNIAVQVGLRSTCIRRKVGSLIVKNNVILSSGYNGSPKGVPNCSDDESRCYRSLHNIPSGEQLDKCYAVHSEINALMQANKEGNNLEGAQIYVTTFPCSSCAKAIIQSGIKEVFYINTYENSFTKSMLEEAGVKLNVLDGSIYRTPDIDGGQLTTSSDLDCIDPLVQEIYKYEPGTIEFTKNRHDVFIKNNLYDRYNEDILAVDYKFDKEISEIDELTKMLCSLTVKNRSSLEYNGDSLKQLVVACIVINEDASEVALLESIEGRLKGKLTMIQGHVSVDESYKKIETQIGSEIDVLQWLSGTIIASNMAKEIFEEIGLQSSYYKLEHNCIIQTNDNKISSEHVGIVFIARVKSKSIFKQLKSYEPEKHKVVRFSTNELLFDSVRNRMDTWLKLVMDNRFL